MTSGHFNVSELDAAYRATAYIIGLDGDRISIRIDQPSLELDQLLQTRGCKEWAFISAGNPKSQPLPQIQNNERHTQLIAAVENLGLSWVPGQGIPDGPDWQPELSLLILGIQSEQALQLAAQFEQNAIVVGIIGASAQLCYLHGNSP